LGDVEAWFPYPSVWKPYGSVCAMSKVTVRATKREQSSEPARKVRLDAQTWVHGALAMIGAQGLAALSVESLATELGVTKGSFYWHFANRDALIAAALERWEELATQAVIDAAERGGSPRERLSLLLEIVVRPIPEDAIEAAIVNAPSDPLVAPVVRRVTQRRLAYLASIFRDLGFGRAVAARRAYTAYAAYLGMLQLEVDDAQHRSVRSASPYVDELITMFVSGAPNPD
jgi:AcrR family transcriptional regulator